MINPNNTVASLSTESTIPQGDALELRNSGASHLMDNNNKYKEALKGLAKSLELEPDLGALHSQQNALMQGFNGAIHARHNPSVWSTFIRQYFCLLVSYVNPMVIHTLLAATLNQANDLRSLLKSNATPKY